MRKRILCLLLSAVLIGTLCVSAFAEDLDQELSRVTLEVKKTLSIGDEYSQFDGTVSDMGALRYWLLNWSDEDGNALSVMADADGQISRYDLSEESVERPYGGYAPTLSKVTPTAAAAAAKSFLKTVLGSGEQFTLEEGGAMALASSDSGYYYTVELLKNGIPAPDGGRVQVSSATGKVTSFWRESGYQAYVNDFPSAVPAVSASKAAEQFAAELKLELAYVSDGKGGAVLRYVPSIRDTLYVDGQTGALVDLSDAWNKVQSAASGMGGMNAAAESTADKAQDTLSAAEQAAVQKLQGVLSKEALDAALRKVSALGLSRYTLSSVYYEADPDTDDVRCTLQYARTLSAGELQSQSDSAADNRQFRVITVDARTGALQSGWTYRPWRAKELSADRTALQSAADSFLKATYPAYAAGVALVDGEGAEFRYDRKVNGYFYHDDSVTVSVDPSDGSIAGFSSSWSDKLTFAAVGKPVSEAQARSAFCAAYQATLRYIAYPVAVDTSIPIWKTYADCCGVVAYRYVLGYTWELEGDAILGVDAATGKLVRMTAQKTAEDYTDLGTSFAKAQIEALSAAGIRFGASTQFKPLQALTEKEMLVLLLNSCGYRYDVEELGEDELDSLYNSAWDEGFLPRSQRSPDKIVTRLSLVKAIVGASPYGAAAGLKGIFTTSFRDQKQIPAADLGYVAIAEGLGMVHGDAQRRFAPGRAVTRQAAAAMLYSYMNR